MKPLHFWVSPWMASELNGRQCGRCGTFYRKENVIQIGLRYSEPDTTYITLEHQCDGCQYRETTSLANHANGSLEEMCFMLLDEIQKKRSIEKSQSMTKQFGSKQNKQMTNNEVNEFLKNLNNFESHDDFMKHIKADQYQPKNKKNEHNKDKS